VFVIVLLNDLYHKYSVDQSLSDASWVHKLVDNIRDASKTLKK